MSFVALGKGGHGYDQREIIRGFNSRVNVIGNIDSLFNEVKELFELQGRLHSLSIIKSGLDDDFLPLIHGCVDISVVALGSLDAGQLGGSGPVLIKDSLHASIILGIGVNITDAEVPSLDKRLKHIPLLNSQHRLFTNVM